MQHATIDLVFTAADAERFDFGNRIAIVIDVLRATTTMLAAFEAGATEIYPAATVEEARERKRILGDAWLCGERHGFRVSGFDYGNSPVEIASADMRGKPLVLTTTNGTRAIAAILAGDTGPVALYAGAIRNATATALMAAHRIESEIKGIVFVCAGTDGEFSLDDLYAGGCMIDALCTLSGTPEFRFSDSAQLAAILAERPVEQRLTSATCRHVGLLERKGFSDDIAYAFQPDRSDLVPEYSDGAFHPANPDA